VGEPKLLDRGDSIHNVMHAGCWFHCNG